MMTQPKKNTFSWLCNLVSLKIELFSFLAKVYPVMNPSKIAYKKKHMNFHLEANSTHPFHFGLQKIHAANVKEPPHRRGRHSSCSFQS